VCFVPLPARAILIDRRSMSVESNLESGGLARWTQDAADGMWERPIVIVSLGFLVLNGTLYLISMIVMGTYAVTLADDRGSRIERTVIYRCRRESTLREVVDALGEVARLSVS
jgi:hypothetical protein